MPVSTLFEYPDTPEKLAFWSFQHQAHHRDIIRVAFEQGSVVLSEFALDPFNPLDAGELDSWLHAHQDMHDQMNAALAIEGHPIWEVDWNNLDEMIPWLQLHGNEHYLAGQILNLD